MSMTTIVLYALAGIGVLAIVLGAWFLYEISQIEPPKTENKPEPKQEAFTAEERFLAELLLAQNDIRNDAFATSQEMTREARKQPPTRRKVFDPDDFEPK